MPTIETIQSGRLARVKKVATAFAVGGVAVSFAAAMIPQAQAATAVKPQSPKHPHKAVVVDPSRPLAVHPDTTCTGSTLANVGEEPSLTFWYTKEANSLVCVGTVEGAIPGELPDPQYLRVRVWEEGVLFSSRHFSAHYFETQEGASTSGGGPIRLEFAAPVEVCDAFVYDGGKVTAATCDTPPNQ
jgi:hypothetical protein